VVSDGMPLTWRIRQLWADTPRTERVNRVLYALTVVSMLALLLELALGDKSATDVDVAARSSATTRPTASSLVPTTAALPDTAGATTGGLSLAEILAQVTIPSIPDAPGSDGEGDAGGGSGAGGATTPGRSTGTTAPAGRSQPSGGGGGGPGTTAAPQPAATQPPSDPDPDPPATSPPTSPTTQPPVTRPPVPRTMPSIPDFSIPTATTSCGRRCP